MVNDSLNGRSHLGGHRFAAKIFSLRFSLLSPITASFRLIQGTNGRETVPQNSNIGHKRLQLSIELG